MYTFNAGLCNVYFLFINEYKPEEYLLIALTPNTWV